jgi:hypothetical protein
MLHEGLSMSTQNSSGLSIKIASCFALLVALILCASPIVYAQSAGSASVQGTVTDPTGAAVPDATLTLTNTDTHVARSTVTDAAGLYSLPNVSVGPYSLTVAASGFSGFTQTGVLEVGNNLQINPVLKIGAATEHEEVQAAGVAVETETSSFKQVIDQKRIVEMPLNGRDATQLILVAGGAVTAPAGDIVTSKNYYTSKVFAVAGSQGNYNNYLLDGGTNTDVFTNSNLPFPFPDALREFSVETNSLPARNGLHPGGLINAVTNSGTNQWHGTVFEFLRNNIINANNFFSTTKDSLKRNQFGGTFGGRILTDKLFFFGGYQGTRNRFVSNATGVCIPTAAELSGDFSHMGGNCPQATANIIDPVSGANISATRKVPASSISQQALNLAKYLPLAQADQYGRVQVSIPANYTEDQYVGRVDYTLNAKHSIFGRYFLTNFNLPAYYSPTNLLVTTAAGNDQRVQNFTLGYTWIVTPKLVNTFHGTYARRRNNRGPTAGGINANTIGVNLYLYAPVDLRLSVANNFSVGCGTCSPGFFNTNTEEFSDDVDWIHGKHQFAFGGEVVRSGQNTQVGYLFNGSYNFGGASSGVFVNGVQQPGEPMVDFITGTMSNSGTTFAFAQSRAQQTTYRQTLFSIYGQDTYHFTSRLTANIGLRWEPMLFPVDKFGRGSTFSQAAFNANQHSTRFPLAPAGSFFYGDAGVPKSFTDNRYANLSPRASLTYDPFGKGETVFRLGSAIMYDNPGLYTVQRTTSNPPFTDEIDVNGPVSFAKPWGNNDPFPGVFPPDATSIFPQGTLFVIAPRHIQTPTVYQWTASVQQDLGRGWMASLNYLGNHNAHLWLGRTPNPAVYIPGKWNGPGTCGPLTIAPSTASNPTGIGNACSSTSNTNTRTVLSLANPTQGQLYSSTMTFVDDGANTSYNGLIAAVQHRMSSNFSFLANYTWSHCLAPSDSPGDVTGPSYSQAFNPRADRGPCGYDVRHIFNTTAIAASHFSSLHGWAGALANNWQIAPLLRITSGLPINITSGTDNSLTGQNLDRPNFIGLSPDAAYTHKKITQSAAGNRSYFNKAAFSQNAPGTFGNLGRNAFRGPNSYTLDASLSRNFPLYERLALNLRLEAFNLLNHPNFPNNAPPPSNAASFTTALNSGTFGYVNAAADPRIFQAAAKFTF